MDVDFRSLILPRVEPDGALVELRAAMAGGDDWRRVAELLKSAAAMVDFSLDSLPAPAPADWLPLFGRDALFSCRISGLLINVHFNDPAVLELELDPREIDERRVDGLGRLWTRLGDLLGRPVALHGEESGGAAILAYDPAAKRFE